MGLFFVGLGGALGALSRYGLSGWVLRWSSSEGFPYATLVVNLVGCLLIGIVWGLSERFTFHDHLGLFLLTGFLAAFTTFSTFC
ncbi:MAG TPA: CrcB family protein, partial [Candidatus Omnitrophota bacterium]|nr:CrcB family protein [Candidatus Omnitrophota bacterium]